MIFESRTNLGVTSTAHIWPIDSRHHCRQTQVFNVVFSFIISTLKHRRQKKLHRIICFVSKNQ